MSSKFLRSALSPTSELRQKPSVENTMNIDDRGRSVRRLEDARFLTGRGRYVEDFALPGEVHAHVLRSPHAHAVIERVDISSAREADGILGVFTEADLRADGI